MERDPPSAGPNPPRRVPRQRRSRDIVDAILEATRQLLAESGPETLTTNRIAERAGISIGSLYRYFPDKAAVVEAVVATATRREAADLNEAGWAIDRVPLAEGLVRIVDYQIERHRRLVEQGGDLYRDHHQASSLSRTLGSSAVEARIRGLLDRHSGETRVGDSGQAAYLLVRGVSAILRLTMEERPEKLAEPSFRDELLKMVVGYVCGETKPETPPR